MFFNKYFYALVSILIIFNSVQSVSAKDAVSVPIKEHEYSLPKSKIFDSVIATFGQLNIPIENSSSETGTIKATHTDNGLMWKVSTFEVQIEAKTDASAVVRLNRYTMSRLHPSSKPDNEPVPYSEFFTALEKEINKRM